VLVAEALLVGAAVLVLAATLDAAVETALLTADEAVLDVAVCTLDGVDVAVVEMAVAADPPQAASRAVPANAAEVCAVRRSRVRRVRSLGIISEYVLPTTEISILSDRASLVL
jgi:hypothetical protein